MKLTIKQWNKLDDRMETIFNEALYLIDTPPGSKEHKTKYIELLSLHCDIPSNIKE